MTAPRVFVIQEQPRHDVSPALDFGDIVTLLPPGDTTFSYHHTVAKLEAELADLGPQDWLLLTGDPVAIGLACVIASRVWNSKLRLLKWHRREMRYLPVEVNI